MTLQRTEKGMPKGTISVRCTGIEIGYSKLYDREIKTDDDKSI